MITIAGTLYNLFFHWPYLLISYCFFLLSWLVFFVSRNNIVLNENLNKKGKKRNNLNHRSFAPCIYQYFLRKQQQEMRQSEPKPKTQDLELNLKEQNELLNYKLCYFVKKIPPLKHLQTQYQIDSHNLSKYAFEEIGAANIALVKGLIDFLQGEKRKAKEAPKQEKKKKPRIPPKVYIVLCLLDDAQPFTANKFWFCWLLVSLKCNKLGRINHKVFTRRHWQFKFQKLNKAKKNRIGKSFINT
ncbi:hypothetical protein RFI_10219 [Reticulomyxa filosa]|uniref:Transmembrane protein n=1 Tax=Reticulomyxa filosa TaxID=46433 RepID=X6NLR6_RETFI|nr:hypothetical protein RFI_10219 [Reticulomyxa filosa]|eukprot:ETO26916.1 hypothetical protein RFI_10219 [Reticulomyxa filosa]